MEKRTAALLEAERLAGLRLLMWVRIAVMAALLIWAVAVSGGDTPAREVAVPITLAALGWIQAWVAARLGLKSRLLYALVAGDHVILTWAVLGLDVADTSVSSPWYAAHFLLLAGASLAQAPALLAWSGLMAALSWAGGVLIWMIETRSMSFDALAALTSQALLLLLGAATLAAGVARSGKQLDRLVMAEASRANLARHFSPDLVERLAFEGGTPLARSRHVAVLFADMRGFTKVCEMIDPPELVATLGELRTRLERCAFAHRGTVDKHVGDATMVLFGALEPTAADAATALRCALEMQEAIADWNRERAIMGEWPVSLSIGVHWGPAVVGMIHTAHRVEFTALGDTVNVASRLERLTRKIGADIAVSSDVAAFLGPGQMPPAFKVRHGVALRGRQGLVDVYWRPAVPAEREDFD